MNVIVMIDGRKAIPVRAIPFLTNWSVISADAIAKALADDDDIAWGCLSELTAYHLKGEEQQALDKAWWKNFPVKQLAAISSNLKAQESAGTITREQSVLEWRRQSLLALPAAVFIWKDDFARCYSKEYTDSYARFVRGSDHIQLSNEEKSKKYALTFSPFIQDPAIRAIVMDGFGQFASEHQSEASKEAGLIAQAALDRLKKAKTALARREALLISADRPGGLAELEALESAVAAAEKEVEAALHAICVMRGDYLDASLEAQPSMLIGTALTETDSIRLVHTTLGLRGVPKSQGLMQGTQLSKQLGKEFLKKGSQPALDPEQKAEIAKLFQQGVSVNKLSTMYPASRRTIDETLKEAGLKLHVTPRKQKKGAQFPPALPLRSRMK